MSKQKIVKVLIGVLVSMSLSGCYFLPEEETVAEVPELVESNENLYPTVAVTRGDIDEKLVCNGATIPTEVFPHYFTEGGKVKKFYVNQGDKVEEGQLLAELESTDFEDDIKLQAFTIKQIEAQMALEKKENREMLEEEIGAAEVEINKLEKEIAALKETLVLNEALLKEGLISESEVKTTQNDIEVNEENKKLLENKMSKWQKSLTEGEDEKLESIQLDYEKAMFQKQLLEEKMERSKLYASCSGVIAYKTNKLAGEMVNSEEEVFRVANVDDFFIKYEGESASEFNMGEGVTLTYLDKDYEGEVVMTPKDVPKEKKEEFNKMVYFKINDTRLMSEMKSGQMIKITKIKKASKGTLLLPTKAVKTISAKQYVYTIENGIRVQKGVVIGINNEAYTEIKEGLEEGEEVIIQ